MYQSQRRYYSGVRQTGSGFIVPAGGGGGSSLLTGLVASWKLDDLTDATGRGNALTNNNTATFNTGKVGNAVYLTRASSQFLSLADNADVSTGDVDFTIGCWVYLTSKPSRMMIVTKDDDTTGDREYALSYVSAEDRFRFEINKLTDSGVTVDADVLGTPSTATWYCVIAWHDAAGDTVNISINDGAANSNPTSGPAQASGGATFMIGARQYASFEEPLDGRVDNVNIWKRVITSGERTSFYNAGAGIEYPF